MFSHAAHEAAETVDKALQLNHPSHAHGATKNDAVEATSPASDTTDADSSTENEQVRDEKHPDLLRVSTSRGLVRTVSGVDVEQAERDFASLSKEMSREHRRMSRVNSRASNAKGGHDIEKAITSTTSRSENWSLEDVLRGNRQAEADAGIKSKHIGVLWQGLTVRGFGGSKIFM